MGTNSPRNNRPKSAEPKVRGLPKKCPWTTAPCFFRDSIPNPSLAPPVAPRTPRSAPRECPQSPRSAAEAARSREEDVVVQQRHADVDDREEDAPEARHHAQERRQLHVRQVGAAPAC